MIVILAIIENIKELTNYQAHMPATTIYPCVSEKQIFLNGNYYDIPNSNGNGNGGSGSTTNLKNILNQARLNEGNMVLEKSDGNKFRQNNYKSIMIIDVLNRLCPQINETSSPSATTMTTVASSRPIDLVKQDFMSISTTTTTTTTATTSIQASVTIPSPKSSLSSLTTSNVKRLNNYFMQQNTLQRNSNSVEKEIFKFKNFKDINNKLYSLRQFYENQQKIAEATNLIDKIEESTRKCDQTDTLNITSSETKNDNSETVSSSKKQNDDYVKIEAENFEEKLVNDLDSLISSLSMNDYHVTTECANNVDNTQSSSSSSSCSSTSSSNECSDAEHSSRSSENGDEFNIKDFRVDDDFDPTESKFHYEFTCNSDENNVTNDDLNTDSNQIKDPFDETVDRQEPVENILNLVVHRLPGENLGIGLRVEQDGITVTNVLMNSAAERASDFSGNGCPIREGDELLEINGVSLKNLAKDEILAIVEELPLYVTMTIRRRDNGSPLPLGIKSIDTDFSGHITPNTADIKIPPNYSLHTVYLSSLESKCIMPDDLQDCLEIEGLFKMQRSTLQIDEEDHLQKGDIIYNINGEYYKNKFDVISKLSSLSGIAEISVLRKSNAISCFASSSGDIPYCNSIFAQNSIKLTMRKYEKPSMKSNSDAEFAYAISERASVEPQTADNDATNCDFTENHGCTLTTIIKSDNDSSQDNQEPSGPNRIDVQIEQNIQPANLSLRPKIGEIEAKIHDADFTTTTETKIQIKVTATFETEHSPSSYQDDNWIFFGKKSGNEENKSENFQTTSSILLNNELSNNDTDQEKTKNTIHISAIDIVPNHSINAVTQNTDGNYYFTEDTTLRTLTNSSCHSDRSLVQLNLVCCEIDVAKTEENEKTSSRISEEEEEEEEEELENKALMNLDSVDFEPNNHVRFKSSLNQDSTALKSYSHLPSSSCSSSEQLNKDSINLANDFSDQNQIYSNSLEKTFVNSCKIELTSSRNEKNEQASKFSSHEDLTNDDQELTIVQDSEPTLKAENDSLNEPIVEEHDIDTTAPPSKHKTVQEEELSTILQNMINEIEERSKVSSQDELPKVRIDEPSINDNNCSELRKSGTAVLLEKLNARAIGTIIYENCVDATQIQHNSKEENKNESENKIGTLRNINDELKIDTTNKIDLNSSPKSESQLASPHHMKNQLQLELLQLVNGTIKGKAKLASMIKRIQDNDDVNEEGTLKIDTDTLPQQKTSTPPPPPPPLPPIPNFIENHFTFKKSTNSIKSQSKDLTNIFNTSINKMDHTEKNYLLNDKFSSLICPQPFHLQKGSSIKKTFSMQNSHQTQNNVKLKNSLKDSSTCFPILKHSMSFSTKHENSKDEQIIDYVDSAFEKETKKLLQSSPSPQHTEIASNTNSMVRSDISCENNELTSSNSKLSSVKEKILLFTKNKRPSFHSKRPQCQFIIDNHSNAVISRKPTSAKAPCPSYVSFNKSNHSILNQPAQLILPDLSKTIVEPKIPPKPKRISPKNSIKNTNEIPPTTPEFKSVRDRVAYFSSRLVEKPTNETHTVNISSIARTITPVVTTITSTTTATIATTTTTMSNTTMSFVPKLTSCYKAKSINNLDNNTDTPKLSKHDPEISHKLAALTTSSTNLNKFSAISNSTSNLLKPTTSTNQITKQNILNQNENLKQATNLEVKNILIPNANENKIMNLIERFTKRT